MPLVIKESSDDLMSASNGVFKVAMRLIKITPEFGSFQTHQTTY